MMHGPSWVRAWVAPSGGRIPSQPEAVVSALEGAQGSISQRAFVASIHPVCVWTWGPDRGCRDGASSAEAVAD